MRLGRRTPRCRAHAAADELEPYCRPDGPAYMTQPKPRRLDDSYKSTMHDGRNPRTTKVLAGLSGHPSTSLVSPGSRRPTGTANAQAVRGHIRSGHTETKNSALLSAPISIVLQQPSEKMYTTLDDVLDALSNSDCCRHCLEDHPASRWADPCVTGNIHHASALRASMVADIVGNKIIWAAYIAQ